MVKTEKDIIEEIDYLRIFFILWTLEMYSFGLFIGVIL